MKKIIQSILILFLPIFLIAQDEQTVSLCVNIDEINPEGYNLLELIDDPTAGSTIEFPSGQCYWVEGFRLFLSSDPSCCNTYSISFFVGQTPYNLDLQIKCPEPKPNCTIIDLAEYPDTVKATIIGCENTPITYVTPEAPGQLITWDAGVVSISTGPDNVAVVSWPEEGDYTLTLTVGSNITTYCIEIIESPVADFDIIGGCGCLNSEVDFMSTGIGGNEFFWDYGDGSFGSGASSSHTYTTPGIYDVTLVVVQDNFDDRGNPICCCTDTIIMPLTIEPLEGPDIYWISTLCEGDTTKYWTDAMDCTYTWTATDSDGNTVLPISTDITNDTLCVVWGDGPFGTVSLEVSGCSDGPYCVKPSSVIVPIIEENTTIEGRDTVCSQSSAFYDVPKWPTVEYEWEIVPPTAGSIVSGQGTNSIVIQWNTGPASATINVNYGSEFLGGIVGHTPDDCDGSASFDVDILPEFEIKQPLENKFCIDEDFILEAGDVGPTTIDPVNGWTWEIRPPVGSTTTISGIFGPYTTSLSMPGSYVIAAYPDFPNPYCNDTVFASIEIIEVPLPDSISGNKEICPGDIETYFGYTSAPGMSLEWEITNGASVTVVSGNPITISWGAIGPYIVKVRQVQISNPNCKSDYITCIVEPKVVVPVTDIIGSGGCANEVFSYTVSPLPIDPDITFSWSISLPASAGSVVSGENSTSCDIQWNAYSGPATINFTQTLCGTDVTYSEVFMINQAAPVTISQTGVYCVGSTTSTLTASTAGASYDWDTPSGFPTPDAQTITIVEPGNYTLTVTESTGCTAVANFAVNEIPGPNTNLSSPDILTMCTTDIPNTVSLVALTGPWTITEWWKKTGAGPYMLLPVPTNTLEVFHSNSGSVETCIYYYVAENAAGCESISNTLVVNQEICPPGGPGIDCEPQNHNTDLTYTPMTNCNVVTFNSTISGPVTITSWNANDPINAGPLGTSSSPTFTYSTVGYYVAYMNYYVPSVNGVDNCGLSDTTSVCVPMIADFIKANNNCGEYVFTNTSSYIDGMAPNTFNWDFGDTNTDSGATVGHTYTSSGTYTVTLTITNPDGCQSMMSMTVDVLADPIADIITMPNDTCLNKPIQFSNLDDTGIVAWDWTFGDGSSNGSAAPLHSYTSDGTKTVMLTVTDEYGCTASTSTAVTIHPAPVEGPITYADDLLLCAGEIIILNAPAGDTYLWSTGETTASINISMGGEYGVTVSDANDCMFSPDPVEVIELPEVVSDITGSNVICDEGCTTLYAASEAGYVYEWRDQTGTIIPPNSPASSIDICEAQGILEVNLLITDANGCTGQNTINIEYFDSPDVTITPSDPVLCAGTPIVLTASSTYPDPVDYQWSTGAIGNTITVGLEGSYFVTVTDPVTGCSSSDFIIINPLPDLCIVPTGCYNTCDPDTLCAPAGLDGYEWYYNGNLEPMWSGLECIIVSETGAYNFEGTNSFNCTDISDTLYLVMEPCCRAGDTELEAVNIPAIGACCYSFSYELSQDIFYSLDLHSDDAGLGIDVGSVNPALSITSSIPALNSFESSTSGDPLPLGPINNFITICLEDATDNPVTVLADWRGEDGSILCTDTLTLECEVEPDCIYVQSDTIYCGPNDQLILDMTVCNPADAAFSVSYIDLVEFAPASAMITPSFVDLSPGTIAPGDCISLSFELSGSGISNDSLKYKLIGHENNPNEDPSTLCCSSDVYCEFIPGCSLCDMIYISSVDSSDVGDCCYDINVFNYGNVGQFTSVGICAITPDASFDIVNPMGSDWVIDDLTSTTANLSHDSGAVPVGASTLPTICIAESLTPVVQIEIKWFKGNDVICRDTIEVICENDCGYMSNASLVCGEDGTWVFTGWITNTSDHIMNSANIDMGIDGFDGYDGSLDLGTLAPGDTYGPFVIIIDIPSEDFEQLCVITTLHSSTHTDAHETCCQFKTIIDVPQGCDTKIDCECGPDFEDEVQLGINCTADEGQYSYLFSPVGNFSDCDRVRWNWISEGQSNQSSGNESVLHTFPGPGEYKVCMTIIRTTPTGKQCKERYCKEVDVFPDMIINTYPNPATTMIFVNTNEQAFDRSTKFELVDMNNRLLKSKDAMLNSDGPVQIMVDDLKTGIYVLRMTSGDLVTSRRIMVVR